METAPPLESSSSVNEAGSSSANMEQRTPEHMDVQATHVETSGNEESGPSSRLFVSDEQRNVKLRFEEKQREEARRIALAEKQAKKKVCMVET
jgi:hypothetical protein